MKILNLEDLLLIAGGCDSDECAVKSSTAEEEVVEITVAVPELYATLSFPKLSFGCCK